MSNTTRTTTKRTAPPRVKHTKPLPPDLTIAEFIELNTRTKRDTLRFLKSVGLTYDKHGNPHVVPR